MTDFRALCAELVSEIQALRRAVADEVGCSSPEPSVIARARAALAQPEPQGPQPIPVSDRLPMTDLSPAAEAVLDAANGASSWGADDCLNEARQIAAAALRAAADQVVPEPPMIVEGGRTYEEAWTATVHDDIRRRFLAIAAELNRQ